ncbi:MAG: NYN domain-containing protein, partial [Terriglobia bacterium]
FTHPHINAYVIVGGDSDFLSLVEKLKQYDKKVFVVGGRAFTSTILQKNCREFINYESLMAPAPSQQQRHGRGPQRAAPRPASALPLSHVMPLLHRALEVLARREVQPQLGLLKSTMLQLDSSFTERDYGTSSFRQFVEMLDRSRLVRTHKEHGHYLIMLPPREEEARVEEPVLKREDALPILHRALRVIDENDLWGRLDFNAVREYVERLESGFDEKRYGFGQFAELLNYAQDLSLVRLAPDDNAVLRVYPGLEFTPSRPMAPAAIPRVIPMAEARPAAERWEAASDAEARADEMAAAAAGEEAAPGSAEPAPAKKKRVYRRRSRPRARSPRSPRKPQPDDG